MARDIADIQQEMVDTVQADETLNMKLTSTSKTALWRLTTYVVATAIWMLETLYDELVALVNSILATQKTHNLYWYAEKAKEFQYGYALVPDTDYYETIDEDAQIVSHAAVDEIAGKLFMKVAKDVNGELAPLSTADPDELTPFEQYILKVKDAGVVVNIVSDVGDDLRLVLDIYYDPLVLNENGELLTDPGQIPAEDTIKTFISGLPFNGEFIPANLVDALQATTGIDIPEIRTVDTKYAANDWQPVYGKVVPNAGYLTISDENLTINYIANVRN
ncbi:hypothetical protein [Carboxylicivirga linearis]|uniref:Nucleotidyltransferase n=1 Tax=Carboxylicivirga linearis TaxID=1628157 RepID=A0ABS5K0Q2_9BACT|nr:hypothetical protein [Carboxylicivirga linearis]MBS2100717.1 hypothetical protein [Carboxylicivirga linearis]